MSLITPTGPRAPGAGRRAAAAVAVLAAGVAAALVATFVLVIGVAVGPCGGDGGSPYAADASPQGRACAFLDDAGIPLVAALEVLCLLAALVALTVWVRDGRRRRRAMLCVAAVPLVPVLLALLAFPFFAALGDRCAPYRGPDDNACETY